MQPGTNRVRGTLNAVVPCCDGAEVKTLRSPRSGSLRRDSETGPSEHITQTSQGDPGPIPEAGHLSDLSERVEAEVRPNATWTVSA